MDDSKKASGRRESTLASGPAVGISQETRDVCLADDIDRFGTDQLLEDDEIVAVGLDGVGRSSRLFELAPVPGSCQSRLLSADNGGRPPRTGLKVPAGPGAKKGKLIGRFVGKSLFAREKGNVVRVRLLPLRGGQAVAAALSGAR